MKMNVYDGCLLHIDVCLWWVIVGCFWLYFCMHVSLGRGTNMKMLCDFISMESVGIGFWKIVCVDSVIEA